MIATNTHAHSAMGCCILCISYFIIILSMKRRQDGKWSTIYCFIIFVCGVVWRCVSSVSVQCHDIPLVVVDVVYAVRSIFSHNASSCCSTEWCIAIAIEWMGYVLRCYLTYHINRFSRRQQRYHRVVLRLSAFRRRHITSIRNIVAKAPT